MGRKMILKDIIKKIGLKIDSFTVCTPFFEVVIAQNEDNKIASWQLYVELITRVATQPMLEENGDERAALDSIYKLFDITRDIIKQYGRKAESFSMFALCLLNIVLRPFTTKWHKIFLNEVICKDDLNIFRDDLVELQQRIYYFSGLLFQMSRVNSYEEIEFDIIEKHIENIWSVFITD